MQQLQRLRAEIVGAFESVERPAEWALRGSSEGDEPYLVEKEFRDKGDWRTIDPGFLDRAPEGLASALSFLSDEAFRFYLPAYLLADLDGQLQRVDPVFHLCHGLTDAKKEEFLNPGRYGARTWQDSKRHKFSVFTQAQARAILSYLRYKAEADLDAREEIEEAIRNYWRERAA